MTAVALRDPSVVGLKGKLLTGMALATLANALNRGLVFLGSVLLARLLGPETMGLGALAALILGAVILSSNRGVPQSVVRMRRHDFAVVADTGFYLMLVLGVGLSAALALLAPILARAFDQPALAGVLPVISIAMFAFAAGRIHASVVDRQLQFWRRFVPQALAGVGFLVASLPLALAGAGIWSVVSGHVAYWSVWSVGNVLVANWRPGRRFSWPVAWQMLLFTRDMTLTGLASYGFRNVDNLAVARLFGASALGIYSVAFNLASAPRYFGRPLGDRALFPVFAAAQDDPEELRRLHRLTTRLFATGGMLFGVLAVALAPDFVRVVYGEAWLGVVVPLQVLALQGALGAVELPNQPLLTALDRRRELYPITFSTLGLLVLLLYPASQFGLVAVSAAACFAWVVGELASFFLVARALGISRWYFLAYSWKPLLGATLAALPTIVLPDLLFGHTAFSVHGVLRLAAQAGAAVGLYGLWLLATDASVLENYRQLRALLRQARLRRDAAARAAEGAADDVGAAL